MNAELNQRYFSQIISQLKITDLTIDNNVVIYNGNKLDISNLNLGEIVSKVDNKLNAESLFKVMSLNAAFENKANIKVAGDLQENKSATQANIDSIKTYSPALSNMSSFNITNQDGSMKEFIKITTH